MLELARRPGATAAGLDTVVEVRCGLVSSLANAGDAMTARGELKRALTVARGRDDMTLRLLLAWDAPLVWRVRA
ncbi:hypothetical protein ABQF26_41775, partial [Mycolicibacterium elephantis]